MPTRGTTTPITRPTNPEGDRETTRPQQKVPTLSNGSIFPTRPSENFTFPPGFPNIPANFTFPSGFPNAPANFTFSPGFPNVPANFTFPPGFPSMPANFTFPPGFPNMPANSTMPSGFLNRLLAEIFRRGLVTSAPPATLALTNKGIANCSFNALLLPILLCLSLLSLK
ncbi:hypothetical protein ACOMHN_060769 [Nucella lapillus]